jgi:hypothetical protein
MNFSDCRDNATRCIEMANSAADRRISAVQLGKVMVETRRRITQQRGFQGRR